jgi:membrane-bound lytic murein transglycosylase D
MRRRRMGSGRTLLLVGSAAAVAVSGCQRVATAPPLAPAPTPTVGAPAFPELVGAQPGPARAVPLPPLQVDAEVDPILHSLVASDPVMEERVAFWVDFWTSRGSGHFSRYLERMALYEGLVERELADRGLPLSLKYLPIVESGYHDVAVSRVGATGLWQLMAPTAGGLGLTVNAIVDDRRDAIASTRAALDYLQEMHGLFDSWFLALAAYNAGPGRIRGIVTRNAPGREMLDDAVYMELRPHLPAETREFVPRFLAAARIARDPETYGFGRPDGVAPLAFDEVQVPDATSLDVVAWAAGVEEAVIRGLNPHYLRGFTPVGQARAVRIPAGRAAQFEVAYATVPPAERISFMEHTVARGETLGGISGRYGIRLADLQAANGNLDPRRLQVGQRLVIPVAGGRPRPAASVAAAPTPPAPADPMAAAAAPSAAAVAASSAAAPLLPVAPPENPPASGTPAAAADGDNGADAQEANGEPRLHQVRAGENLSVVARRYGVSVAELERWNTRRPGQVLRIGEELVVGPGVRTHTVVRGDTWGALAQRFGVTAAELAQANGRTTRQVIRVGESLRIP